MSYQISSHDQTIEVHDWDEPLETSILAADFGRIHVLLSIFDGDPAKWLDMIETVGTQSEKVVDAPFLRTLQQRTLREPHLIDDLRRTVGEFVRLVTPPPRTS